MTPSIFIATRGSALALAQSNLVLAQCRQHFPALNFELKIIKTTGDKLQSVNLANPNQESTKGLFTKELELALLSGEAAFAVHSLKDLPTDLPPGLHLSAVSEREDVRDVLIYQHANLSAKARGYSPHLRVSDLSSGATIATSSTRRQAQLLAIRPDLKTVPIRGNVGTRIKKLSESDEMDGIILALAGLKRLGYKIGPSGELVGQDVPRGTLATILSLEEMLPCVGQAALAYECRAENKQTNEILRALNHRPTLDCVTAERAFLHAMGGGCLSPVAAYAEIEGDQIRLRAVSFRDAIVRRGEQRAGNSEAESLGRGVARLLTI